MGVVFLFPLHILLFISLYYDDKKKKKKKNQKKQQQKTRTYISLQFLSFNIF